MRSREATGIRWPIFIRLLGSFGLFKVGRPVPVRPGGKTHVLLQTLALRPEHRFSRDTLLDRIWPNSPSSLAGQSLNSLVYSLHKALGDCIGGAAPVVRNEESYHLNVAAGIGVDVACFNEAADSADRQAHAGNWDAAAAESRRAMGWYNGDLVGGEDVQAVVERERLRARYLDLLARLADYSYGRGDYAGALGNALQLISYDQCREDAHRLIMRCHVRQGERAQAMRQYRLCEQVLRAEFDAAPEPATKSLFDQVRLDPGSI